MADNIVLTINGTQYSGWTEARVTRGLKQGASDFEFEVSEGWAGVGGQSKPWQINPGDAAVITIGGETVLTGFVEHYEPSYNSEEHTVRILGRSKTCDLVDCMPDVPGGGQFFNNKLDALARAVAQPFGLTVSVQGSVNIGDAFPTVVLDKTETGFAFIEKLARQRSVLITDDANGNVVLTQAGNGGSGGALIEGQNIAAAKGNLSSDKRFQTYVVLSQVPVFDDSPAQNQISATATDSGVKRNRRFAEMAEAPLQSSDAQTRAQWREKHNFGESTQATITSGGFRQTVGGDLWKTNILVPVTSPMLNLATKLLVGKLSFLFSADGGSRTELELAPPDAFTPEPESSDQNNGAAVWTEG